MFNRIRVFNAVDCNPARGSAANVGGDSSLPSETITYCHATLCGTQNGRSSSAVHCVWWWAIASEAWLTLYLLFKVRWFQWQIKDRSTYGHKDRFPFLFIILLFCGLAQSICSSTTRVNCNKSSQQGAMNIFTLLKAWTLKTDFIFTVSTRFCPLPSQAPEGQTRGAVLWNVLDYNAEPETLSIYLSLYIYTHHYNRYNH